MEGWNIAPDADPSPFFWCYEYRLNQLAGIWTLPIWYWCPPPSATTGAYIMADINDPGNQTRKVRHIVSARWPDLSTYHPWHTVMDYTIPLPFSS